MENHEHEEIHRYSIDANKTAIDWKPMLVKNFIVSMSASAQNDGNNWINELLMALNTLIVSFGVLFSTTIGE